MVHIYSLSILVFAEGIPSYQHGENLSAMKFSFCQGRWLRSGGLEVWVVPCALQYLVTFRFVLRYAFSGDIYVTCVNFMEHGMHGAMVQGAELEIS